MKNPTKTLLFLLLMLSPTMAVAQDIAAANKAAAEANAAFSAKDYGGAAEGYRKAYELSPQSPFLVAEAVALHASGDCPSAVGVADRWFGLETSPPAQQLADMSRLVASCAIEDADKALAANDWDAAETQAKSASERDDSERTEADVERVRKAVANGRAEAMLEKPVVAESEERAGTGSNTQKIVGWTLVGLGGASAVFAVTQQLAFNNKSDDFETVCASNACVANEGARTEAQGLLDDMKKLRAPIIIGWSAAGVLVAAGLGMILLSGNGAEVAWVPPAGASVSVRF